MQAFSAAGQEMYQAQASQPGAKEEGMPDMEEAGAPTGGAGGEGESGGDEDVVEADYEIVDEEK